MTINWYSITIRLPGVDVPIFNGYFSADGNIVKEFYETIDGSTDFNNSIYLPRTEEVEEFDANNLHFVWMDGTHIGSMSYFIDNPHSVFGTRPASEIVYRLWWALDGSNYIGFYTYNASWQLLGNQQIDQVILPISDPSCFNEGTKILCLNKNFEEEYVPVENLRKGDLVKSYKYGYRKIDLIGKNIMVNNPTKWNECMYKIEKTKENGLIEDLIITGGHAILVDDLGDYKEINDMYFGGKTQMIDDKYLLLSSVSKDFIKMENINIYTYYHLTLENNGDDNERFGVWANGILTETPSKKYFINHKIFTS